MKNHNTLFSLSFLMAFLISSILSSCKTDGSQEAQDTEKETTVSNPAPEKVLRHVVLFKFTEDATPEGIAKSEAAFAGLPAKIPEIRGFEWGTNNSPEGLNKGFTHCFTLTFYNEADRDVYLPHPDHKALGEVLSPYIEDVMVLDYWTTIVK